MIRLLFIELIKFTIYVLVGLHFGRFGVYIVGQFFPNLAPDKNKQEQAFILGFFQKSYHPIPWRDSISRPIARQAIQGCQIFLGTIYHNGKNIPNVPNGHNT
jgi:hypothetical protein